MNLKKERIAHNPAKRKLFVTLLFLFIAFICFSHKTNAQGWTFTFKMYAQGNCGGAQPPAINIPNLGFPTKSQCESLRQYALSIKISTGGCTVGYTCTPCTGSDIVTPAQLSPSPGNVSFDGQFEGKPLFTTHESQAFQDWAEGYKQQLESYGITSILGKNITSNQIPLTGNINFDKFYYSQSATFNPATPPENLYAQDASVVDLSHLGDKPGVVQLLTNSEEQKKRDEWYQKKLEDQGYDNLTSISTDGITDGGETWDYQKTQHLIFVGIGAIATVSILLAAAPEVATVGIVAALGEEVGLATVISWSLPVVEESVKAIEACVSGNCPTTKEILTNMGVAEVSNLVGTGGEILGGYAAVATQKAIGTISTHGVNSVKYTWNAFFGATDTGNSVWGAVK